MKYGARESVIPRLAERAEGPHALALRVDQSQMWAITPGVRSLAVFAGSG